MERDEPRQGGGSRGRWVTVAVLAVLAVGAGAAMLLWPDRKKSLPPPPRPSVTATPSPSPSKVLPYPWFAVGTCYDHPQLSKVITSPEARPCAPDHDVESVANVLLPDGLTSDFTIGKALRELCKAPVAAAEQRQGGGTFYGYPIAPDLTFYRQGYRDATCGIAASDHQGGAKLHGPLH
ncbi:hypothetical protein ABT095_28595 [Kitasatospora sp. NPDC002227]|uniref:hypothetical protein n=1 Tax=Kitasatospora sp. NPDC002227 TaxID=3154773 RepID=UPI0033206808